MRNPEYPARVTGGALVVLSVLPLGPNWEEAYGRARSLAFSRTYRVIKIDRSVRPTLHASTDGLHEVTRKDHGHNMQLRTRNQ